MKNKTQVTIAKVVKTEVVDDLPIGIIRDRMLNLFSKHIGSKNALGMPEIYSAVYAHKCRSQFQYIFRCQRLMQVMTMLRKTTPCFIVGENFDWGYGWYVVKTATEASAYKNQLDQRINGLKEMKERCDVAVRGQHWKRL